MAMMNDKTVDWWIYELCIETMRTRPWVRDFRARVHSQLATATDKLEFSAAFEIDDDFSTRHVNCALPVFYKVNDAFRERLCDLFLQAAQKFDNDALEVYRQNGRPIEEWYPIAEKVLSADLFAIQSHFPADECAPGSPLLEKHHEAVVEHYILSEDKVISDIGAHIMQTGRWP